MTARPILLRARSYRSSASHKYNAFEYQFLFITDSSLTRIFLKVWLLSRRRGILMDSLLPTSVYESS
jgi:hypothetical protein